MGRLAARQPPCRLRPSGSRRAQIISVRRVEQPVAPCTCTAPVPLAAAAGMRGTAPVSGARQPQTCTMAWPPTQIRSSRPSHTRGLPDAARQEGRRLQNRPAPPPALHSAHPDTQHTHRPTPCAPRAHARRQPSPVQRACCLAWTSARGHAPFAPIFCRRHTSTKTPTSQPASQPACCLLPACPRCPPPIWLGLPSRGSAPPDPGCARAARSAHPVMRPRVTRHPVTRHPVTRHTSHVTRAPRRCPLHSPRRPST